jgi:translation initiation factor 2B subunit (eIF-2B alpha/beta/delta family)
MDETHVVTCVLRNEGRVLLLQRSDEVGSYAGRWGGVAGHAEGDPDAAARREISEETGLGEAVTLVRAGESFAVVDEDLDRCWVVHPYCFESATRDVVPNWETAAYEWVHPTEILRRETVPDLWTSYDRVRPTVETIASDREHGSAFISVRALEVLRDEAGVLALGEAASDGEAADWETLASLARELLAARPAMTVISNRVHRVMAGVDERTAAALERAAREVIDHAVTADGAAAALAAERIRGRRVATLSRSGTVFETIEAGDPEAIMVAESRPGGEGVGVAEALADDHHVTLTSDAALAFELAAWDADTLLVGADTILADGRIVNKVGTRAAAVASAHEGIDVLVVAASDKISPGDDPALETAPDSIYAGDADIDVVNPLFDVTPADCVDGICTERGRLADEDVASIAAEFEGYRGWDA